MMKGLVFSVVFVRGWLGMIYFEFFFWRGVLSLAGVVRMFFSFFIVLAFGLEFEIWLFSRCIIYFGNS